MPTEPTTTSSLQDQQQDQQQGRQEAQDNAAREVGELVDFMRLIDGLPVEFRADFYRALDRLVDGFERRQRILGHIQESLGQMNLDLKYLIFDLEATRRERDDYRRQLEFFTKE